MAIFSTIAPFIVKSNDANLDLLAALQNDAKASIIELSELSATSTASVQRRLRRLRKHKIIQRDTVEINRSAVGFSVKAIISVELERDNIVETDTFKRKAIAEPNIQHCYCIAGEADFTLIVIAKDMSDYEAFTHRFFFSDPNIRKFRTSIVVSEQKASNALPLLPNLTHAPN